MMSGGLLLRRRASPAAVWRRALALLPALALLAVLSAALATTVAATLLWSPPLPARQRVRGHASNGAGDGCEARELMQLISDTTSAPALLTILGQELRKPTFDDIHVAAAFTKLAKNVRSFDTKTRHSLVIEELMQREEALLESGDTHARHAANVLWATATLRERAPEMKRLVPPLIELLNFKAADVNSHELANIVWACAALKLQQKDLHELMPIIVDRVIDRADELNVQGIANIIWATAVLRKEAPSLQDALPVLIEMATDKVDNMSPQDINNIIWATATLREEASCLQALMPLLMEKATVRAPELMAQHVANIIWSVGILKMEGSDVDRLLSKLLDRAVQEVRAFKSQELANLCWGLALCNSRNDTFMAIVAEGIVKVAPTLREKAANFDLPQLVCSFAKLGVRDSAMLSAVESRMSQMLPRMNDWGLSALTWSYEELGASGAASAGFLRRAWLEVERRGISPALVGRSRLGPFEWRRGAGARQRAAASARRAFASTPRQSK